MVQAVIVVAVAVTVLLALRRAWGAWLRRQALASLPPEAIIRQERGVTIRVLLEGTPFLGLNPKRTNHLVGDLALTADRVLLASNRGLLAALGPDRGRRFTSVRSTGPGRLVIEGDVPHPDGSRGLYRFELVVRDASGWADALAGFVREDDEGRRFGRRPPGRGDPSGP